MDNDSNFQKSNSSDVKTKGAPKKYKFYRKPSIKKKGPEIKQTKTSIQRMQKANPLKQYKPEDIECLDQLIKSKELIDPKKPVFNIGTSKSRDSVICSNSSDAQVNKKYNSKSTEQTPIIFHKAPYEIVSSTRCEKVSLGKNDVHTKYLDSKLKSNTNFNRSKEDKSKKMQPKPQKPLRRSLSAQHIDRKNGLIRTDSKKSLNKIKHYQSNPNIHDHENNDKYANCRMSPVQEASRETSLIFKTPSAYERRSIASTPLSAAGLRRSLYQSSKQLPSLHELQKRLNDWLVKRGKNISLFHHLKCFDVPKDIIDEEDKENVETNLDFDKGSYEDLCIQFRSDDIKQHMTVITNDNVESIAKSALVDLLNLIQDGYPLNQCEAWLQLIRDKYSQLQEEPEYWECRAAIEEARGNIINAVECYKTAIIQGAEVQEVDKSLDVLLQKFSLLNINAETTANEKVSKDRERIIEDARNVFKSSIIKFAVQEKKLKKNDKEVKFVATPVRRSTRLSRSRYVQTPGVKICSSLNDLDSPLRSAVNFESNKALN